MDGADGASRTPGLSLGFVDLFFWQLMPVLVSLECMVKLLVFPLSDVWLLLYINLMPGSSTDFQNTLADLYSEQDKVQLPVNFMVWTPQPSDWPTNKAIPAVV